MARYKVTALFLSDSLAGSGNMRAGRSFMAHPAKGLVPPPAADRGRIDQCLPYFSCSIVDMDASSYLPCARRSRSLFCGADDPAGLFCKWLCRLQRTYSQSTHVGCAGWICADCVNCADDGIIQPLWQCCSLLRMLEKAQLRRIQRHSV